MPEPALKNDPTLIRWQIAGIIATAIIVLSVPIYMNHRLSTASDASPSPTFVGSQRCEACHRSEYDRWRQSHHRRAMAKADSETVRGDFNNARFVHFGIESRFYQRDGRYFVYTQGPQGDMGEFEITHTFGWYPLQQYLIPFDDGRRQCLPIAWDVDRGQWYHLYPDQPLAPDDWLYWTNAGQNWNGMCAECHSTRLQKNYDPEQETYDTTWAEISIGCEACHGPGSAHVQWAEMPEMGRPYLENDNLAVNTRDLGAEGLIELCAPCHARRMSYGDNTHVHGNFLDYGVPQLLSPGYYFADGQILEEVYVYGSFMQSKMYARDVRCSDCHDVHSLTRVQEGNALCLQCHQAAVYDTPDHHFHKKAGQAGEPIRSDSGDILFDVGSGAQCEQCHMPGRTYMGIDYRPDHSFRIPRPDLSLSIDVPNACNRCHVDKSIQWSIDFIKQWYGRRSRPHYGTSIAAGRRSDVAAAQELIRLSQDRLYPPIVRATALSLLSNDIDADLSGAFSHALTDEAAWVRWAALHHLPPLDTTERIQAVGPLLYDPVKAVRIEAARALADIPIDRLPQALQAVYPDALAEYEAAMRYTADFATSRHNLANMYVAQGLPDQAIAQYQKAIAIDPQFYPAHVNLAMLYNQQGKKDAAEALLRQVIADHPDLHDIKYSLALLLVERQNPADAAMYLADAATHLPQRARIHYNLGLLLQQLMRFDEAEAALKHALSVSPDHPEYLYALAVFYLNRGKMDDARWLSEQLSTKHPDFSAGQQLRQFLNRQP